MGDINRLDHKGRMEFPIWFIIFLALALLIKGWLR